MSDIPTRSISTARLAATLSALTAVSAIALSVSVAIAWYSAGVSTPAALAGLGFIAALAVATVIALRGNARAISELEGYNAALRARRARDDAANLARARFIADVSHDLRQPLHALGLFLDALDRRVTPGEGEKILAKTRDAANLMGRAFNALIDLTRIDADALVPEVERFAIDDFLIRLGEETSEAATQASVDFRLVDAHVEVVGDQRIIGYILRTLLANAMDLGKCRLLLGSRRRCDTQWIELHCARPGDVAAKWEILRRSSETATAGLRAIELDLFVVRRLAALMGTELRVDAKPGRGISFALALPVAEDGSAAPLRSRAIVLLADDPGRAEARQTALARAGATVHVAGNERQAEYASRTNKVDLLVTDLAGDDPAIREICARVAPGAAALPNRTPLADLVGAAARLLQSK